MRLRHSTPRGLTLIELMLVIGIICVLVGLCLGAYSRGLFRAHRLTNDLSEGQKSIVDMSDRDEGRK